MHARLYIGSYEDVFPHLSEEVRAGGPDVFIERGDLFTADAARALRARAAGKAVAGEKLHIVLAYGRLMPQAQNVLLKELEESQHAVWHIVVPQRDTLLPTVRSRLTHVYTAEEVTEEPDVVREFFSMTYPERLALIAREYEKAKKSDEEKVRVHAWAVTILGGCERRAHADPRKYSDLLHDGIFVRTYIDAPGSSGKMLLELLAMSAG